MLSTYYPGTNWCTYYGLYAPAIERFLLIDTHNLFCFFQTAQVLSSKINTVVLILNGDKKVPNITNENCLQFTLNHSKFQSEISGVNAKQSPTVSFLHSDSKIFKTSFPVDFEKKDRKEKLLELQTYANFVNLCIHSAMLTSLMNQHVHIEAQQEEYLSFYFNQDQKPTFVTQVMNILLFADNMREAQEQLEQYWIMIIDKNLKTRIYWPEKIKKELYTHCTMFYEIINTQLPFKISKLFT